jgi:hypothetical protein
MNPTEVSELIEMLGAMAKRGDEEASTKHSRILAARNAWGDNQTSKLWSGYLEAAEEAKTWLEQNR